MLKGFVLLEVRDSETSRNKIFIFKNTPEIQQAMSEFKSDKVFHTFAESMKTRRK